MNKPLIAVADSVFPNLEPAKEVFSNLDATIRLATEPTKAAILDVAREADALMVTFAQIDREIIDGL